MPEVRLYERVHARKLGVRRQIGLSLSRDEDQRERAHRRVCPPRQYQPVPNSGRDGTVDWRELDTTTHEITLGRFQQLRCTKCGFTIEDGPIAGSIQTYVEDHYWTSEDYCADCGVKGFCQRPDEYVEKLTGMVSRDDLEPISSNPELHTVYADRYEQYYCTRCDARIRRSRFATSTRCSTRRSARRWRRCSRWTASW